jgi:purine-nucleoside phosphorylase
VLGISLVTNLAAGMTGEPLNHEEVLETGKAAASRMGELLGAIVPRI